MHLNLFNPNAQKTRTSRISTEGLTISSSPTDTRRRCPPEISWTRTWAHSRIPRSARMASTTLSFAVRVRCGGRRSCAEKSNVSCTVKEPSRTSSCGTSEQSCLARRWGRLFVDAWSGRVAPGCACVGAASAFVPPSPVHGVGLYGGSVDQHVAAHAPQVAVVAVHEPVSHMCTCMRVCEACSRSGGTLF